MYIFPRQFGLHNVFTSAVDSNQTSQMFPDYSLRESEIVRREGRTSGDTACARPHLPKRLRGNVFELAKRLQRLHSCCAYYELLKHYCPLKTKWPDPKISTALSLMQTLPSSSVSDSQLALRSPGAQTSLDQPRSCQSGASANKPKKVREPSQTESLIVDYAIPFANVSAFCRAVLGKLIPNDFWGQGVGGDHNREVIMHAIDRFIRLRRFESFTLHRVIQGLKVVIDLMLD